MSFTDVMYGPLGQVNQGFQNNLANNAAAMNASNAYLANQQNQMAGWNAESARMAQPTPYGYGFVGGYPSFGPAAAPGTYSPGSGLSSFSGVPLGGGGGSVFDTGTTPFNSYGLPGGGGAGSFSPSPNYPGGVVSQLPAYNASRQYGWDANEGAPVPPQPAPFQMGQFNPHTYGWDANEGATDTPADIQWYLGGSQGPRPSTIGGIGSDSRFGGQADQAWYLGGSQGPRPSEQGGYIGNPAANAFSLNPAVMGDGGFGGAADVEWYLGGSQGPRPSSIRDPGNAAAAAPSPPVQSQDWQKTFNNTVNGNDSAAYPLGGSSWYPGGGSDDPRDVQWMLGGSVGPRPSTSGGGSGYDMGGQSRAIPNPMNRVDWAQSYMPNFSTGGAMGQALLASQYKPFETGGGFGGAEDQAWFLGGSQGPRPSSVAGFNPWASNNTRTPDLGNTFGMGLSNNTLSVPQGSIYQDPFGGYVPSTAPGPDGLPANYTPRYDALPMGYQNPFGTTSFSGG